MDKSRMVRAIEDMAARLKVLPMVLQHIAGPISDAQWQAEESKRQTAPLKITQAPAAPLIPIERQTRVMTLPEAGMILGLESGNKNAKKRRDAAGKAMKLLLEPHGEIRFMKAGKRKYIFDRTQVPDK
jgi:hypothetical protein